MSEIIQPKFLCTFVYFRKKKQVQKVAASSVQVFLCVCVNTDTVIKNEINCQEASASGLFLSALTKGRGAADGTRVSLRGPTGQRALWAPRRLGPGTRVRSRAPSCRVEALAIPHQQSRHSSRSGRHELVACSLDRRQVK